MRKFFGWSRGDPPPAATASATTTTTTATTATTLTPPRSSASSSHGARVRMHTTATAADGRTPRATVPPPEAVATTVGQLLRWLDAPELSSLPRLLEILQGPIGPTTQRGESGADGAAGGGAGGGGRAGPRARGRVGGGATTATPTLVTATNGTAAAEREAGGEAVVALDPPNESVVRVAVAERSSLPTMNDTGASDAAGTRTGTSIGPGGAGPAGSVDGSAGAAGREGSARSGELIPSAGNRLSLAGRTLKKLEADRAADAEKRNRAEAGAPDLAAAAPDADDDEASRFEYSVQEVVMAASVDPTAAREAHLGPTLVLLMETLSIKCTPRHLLGSGTTPGAVGMIGTGSSSLLDRAGAEPSLRRPLSWTTERGDGRDGGDGGGGGGGGGGGVGIRGDVEEREKEGGRDEDGDRGDGGDGGGEQGRDVSVAGRRRQASRHGGRRFNPLIAVRRRERDLNPLCDRV